MQSDFVLEEPEISSFAPKTSHHNETLDTSRGEISTDASGFYPSSAPSKTDDITTDKDEKALLGDEASDANNDLVENGGRFNIPPPKYSDLYSLSSHFDGVESETSYEYYHANKSPRDLLAPHTSEGEKGTPPLADQEQEEDTNSKDGNMGGGTVTKDAEFSESNLHESDTNAESSIFTFPENKKSVGNKPEQDEVKKNFVMDENASNKDFKARRRQRRKQKFLVESNFTDDETSIENYGTRPTSQLGGLQERSHQAWRSRQKKNGIMRSKNDDEIQSQKGSVVSFGASDTVYHFEADSPKQHKYSNEPEEMSIDARSLNSEYTKSLESEVEDMFKDILFIGSPHKSKPGRKKYRYKPENERKAVQQRSKAKKSNRAKDVESAYKADERSKSVNDSQYSTEESTKYSQSNLETDTVGDETRSFGSTVSGESSDDSRTVEFNQLGKDTADDTMQTVMGLVEGGISVMTSALEYAFREEEEEVEPRRRGKNFAKEKGKGKNDYDLFETCGLNVCDQKVEPVSTREIFSRSKNGVPRSALVDPSVNDIDRAPSDEGRRQHQRHMQQAAVSKVVTENEIKPDRSILSLGSGGELVQLAMHAGRTVHKLKGVEYDESIGIDMYNDVKKIHVTLGLPLGIIFLENDGGCFVTKVSRDGSAAKSRRVMVADQLALINGTSGYKMKVDDICDAVSNSTDRGQVELVFLRYIGPFRPSTATQRRDDVPMDIKNVITNKPRTSKESSKKKPTKRKKAFRIFGKKKD